MDKNHGKVIVVNAISTTTGGGLTILQQFLENITFYDTTCEYYVFVGTDVVMKYESDKIHIINKAYKRRWLGRIWWDNVGISIQLRKNKIKPTLIISLQNTGMRLGKHISQIIYYNQSIPFFNYKWEFFERTERAFWIYQNVYPYFVRKHIYNKTKFVVPANWMIERACTQFRINKSKVLAIRSDVSLKHINGLYNTLDKYSFFYPAGTLKYKNHQIIIEALGLIKNERRDIYERIYITLTCNRKDLGKNNDADLERVLFVGYLTYEEMLCQYEKQGTLLFPSYLESFAIPLIEASYYGMHILVSDFQYARETIGGYSGAEFLKHDSAKEWADAIIKIVDSDDTRLPARTTGNYNSWAEFFGLISELQ